MSFQPSPADSSSELNEKSERIHRQQFVKIPGYEIEYEIGRGGMAIVYRAVQKSLSRQVAIKVLVRELDEDDEFVQRFKKEGRILARLLHPNIITIYDVGISEDNNLFLSIEYLSGGTLREKIRQGLSFDSVIQITRAIAKAIGYAHEKGVVHRDIKPSNIMFRHDGTPVLTDFGIARFVDSKTVRTMAGLIVGSPGYMSPEQAMGQTATIQSDLYSLGVVLYEMLTGHRLYESGNPVDITLKHLHDPIPGLPSQYAYLQPVLNKLLEKRSSDRYKNASEFLKALDLILPSDTGIQSRVDTAISHISLVEFATGKIQNLLREKSRWPVIIVSAIVILIAIFYALKLRNYLDQSGASRPTKPIGAIEQARRDQEIAELLNLANTQMKAKLLSGEPGEDNAETTYQRVITLDPGNSQALAGLEAIATEYEKQARKQLDSGALQESLDRIKRGLAAAPKHAELLRLRQDVEHRVAEASAQKAREEEQQQAQLQAEQFLAQAQSNFQEGLLEISLAHIEQGLLAVPDHPDLLTLREQVRARVVEQQRQAEAERQRRDEEARWQAEEAERRKTELARQQAAAERRRREADEFLAQALEFQRKGDYAASLQQIEQGLSLIPDHVELLRLRDPIRAQLAVERKRQQDQAKREQEIKTLLEQAEDHWKAKRFTLPPGNNAEAAYRQVLKLDTGNVQAQAGLGRIAQEYLQQAQQKRSAGALQDCLELIDKGLAVVPNQAELLRLREDVRSEWLAEQQRLEQQHQSKQQEEQQRKEQQRLEQQEKQQQEQQRKLEQRQQEQRRKEQRRLEQRQEERQRQEQQRKEKQRFEQQQEKQRQEQQRLEQQQQEKQRQEQQRKLDQQRQEQQRKEQQRSDQQRQEQQRKEQQPEPKLQPQPAKPRVFGTF